MAKTPDLSQDSMPQGGYANPNATGAVVPAGCYKPYTSGLFDDNGADQGEGQIHTVDNDGYPFAGAHAVKGKGKV